MDDMIPIFNENRIHLIDIGRQKGPCAIMDNIRSDRDEGH